MNAIRGVSAFLCCAFSALGQTGTGRRSAGQPGPPPRPNVQAVDCPEPAAAAPPAVTPLPGDFVELSRSVCFGLCPAYTVRIQADGQIVWHGEKFVETTGERTGQVKPADASALLERFRAAGFWSLCGRYTRSITDVPTTTTVIRIGSQEK